MARNTPHTFSIDRFRKGDRIEFKYVFELYYKMIYLLVYNLVRVEPEAQDIVSEGFVKLWRLHANFKSLDNIRAFLFLTARNASVDHLRLTQRRRSCHQEILHLMGQDEAIENEMIDAAVFDEVSRQIEALPEKCREVFGLLFYHRMSTAETAKELNISARKVQNQKERAIRLLRSALLKNFLPD